MGWDAETLSRVVMCVYCGKEWPLYTRKCDCAQAGVTRMGGDAEGGSGAEGPSTRSRSDAPSPSSSSSHNETTNDR